MDKEKIAIERLKEASEMALKYYETPLLLTDSGGKDSAVCLALAERAGIPFEVLHNHTTTDAPETVYTIRQHARRLEDKGIKYTIDYPFYKGHRVTMWSLIPQKLMPPTRRVRYCCAIFKEKGGTGRFVITGVRWAESKRRETSRGIYETQHKNKEKRIILTNDNDPSRRLFENCAIKAKRAVNPIIDWTDKDVWDYINAEKVPVNQLYSCGFSRVGCIGCPMAGTTGRYFEFARYPQYKMAYIRAFDRMLEARRIQGKKSDWLNGKDVFHWWMEDGTIPGQMELEDYEENLHGDAGLATTSEDLAKIIDELPGVNMSELDTGEGDDDGA